MATIGNFLALYVNNQRVALATSNDFSMKRAMIDITEKESAGYKEVLTGMKEGMCTLEAIATSSLSNYLQWPESFDNAVWVKDGTASISGTKIANDNGQLLAQTLTWGTGTRIFQELGTTDLLVDDYVCFSLYLKGTGTINIEVGDNDSFTVSSTIALSSTWTRYSVVYKLVAATQVFAAVNFVSGSSVSLFGPQLERGQTPTIYKGSKETLTDLANIINNNDKVNLLHSTFITGDQSFLYEGYLSDLQIKSAANDKVTFTCNFQGTGVQTINTI